MGPNGGAGGYGGGSSSHSNHPFDFDQRGVNSDFGSQDNSRSRAAFASHQHDEQSAPLSESELVDAFATLDFDESTRAALAQRLQAMQGSTAAGGFGAGSFSTKRADPFASGYNRDPNAFMFSPFSPSDSPLVGGKADLPNSRSSSSSLHLSHRQEEDSSSTAAGKDAQTAAVGNADR